MILNEHQKLLAKREGMVVLGKNYFNLWLLTLVLIATFLSIAFSNGSMEYLSYKMNDPFTNWVDIDRGYSNGELDNLYADLQDSSIMRRFLYKSAQEDCFKNETMASKDGEISHTMDIRFFDDFNSELMQAILSKENVIDNCAIPFEKLANETYGVFITQEALLKLGYKPNNIPAYINYLSYSKDADILGFKMIQKEYALAPLPVLAVVKSLPGKMDMIASKFLYNQIHDQYEYPLDLNNEDYRKNILYFVENEVTDFEEKVNSFIPEELKENIYIGENPLPELESWKDGKMWYIEMGDHSTDIQAYIDLDTKIQELYKDKVTRLYTYQSISKYEKLPTHFLSVHFYSLDSIRSFEQFAKKGYEVKIEMSQINAKENFNAVSIMANILSLAMILFSIVCIVMFIVNMLQSYFQKVKRNIGTFKAFGINSNELIGVYVLIIFAIVMIAVIQSVAFVWIIEILLDAFDILKDGTHSYLLLWSQKTVMAIFTVIIATVITVYIVMSRLLRQTPGDLIYDRN